MKMSFFKFTSSTKAFDWLDSNLSNSCLCGMFGSVKDSKCHNQVIL